jgi:hypothetical protein
MTKVKVRNFAQFFSLFYKMENPDEELKCELVGTFTGGRTTSLREMWMDEYEEMCKSMVASQYGQTWEVYIAEIKSLRSAVLTRLQGLGVSTVGFADVDNYCLDPRIAGKKFNQLSKEELKRLIRKLGAISGKGKGAKARKDEGAKAIVSQKTTEKTQRGAETKKDVCVLVEDGVVGALVRMNVCLN